MARSSLLTPTSDLISDGGAVLWSIIQGEQLEFQVTLNFLTNAGLGYTFEAVLMEGNNVQDDSAVPTTARLNGVNSTLTVRVPLDRGTWAAATSYNREDVVLYLGNYYKLESGTARVSAVTPNLDTAFWIAYVPNKVNIQFPATLTYAQKSAVTVTVAAPGVFTWAAHPLKEGNPVVLSGTTAPVGFVLGTTYYVTATSLAATTFTLSATLGGTPITTTTAGTAVIATLPAWVVQPSLVATIHGFFELRVTEPAGGVYQRTWKPMRGLVEFLYSPTAVVPG